MFVLILEHDSFWEGVVRSLGFRFTSDYGTMGVVAAGERKEELQGCF